MNFELSIDIKRTPADVFIFQGTLLIQRFILKIGGFLKIISPLVRRMLAPRLHERLEIIKSVLEGGWQMQA